MKTGIRKRLLLFALCLLFFLASCEGAGNKDDTIPSPPETFYVYDGAKVLGEETEEWIVAHDYSLEAQTGAQIVVVCVESTGETDIADYAYRLFNDWGIGSEEKDNGVLLLLSIGEDDYWALQGQGIEDTLSSGMLKLLLNAHLEPHFAAKEYEKGVRETFDALIAFFESAYGVKVDTAAYYAAVENGGWKAPESETLPVPAEESETEGNRGTDTDKGAAFPGFLKTAFAVILIGFAVLLVLAVVAVVIIAFVYKPKEAPASNVASHRETARKNPYSATFRQGYRGTGSPRFAGFRDIGAASRPAGSSKPFTGYSRIGADRPKSDPPKPSGGPNPFSGFSGDRASRPAGQPGSSGSSWPFGIGFPFGIFFGTGGSHNPSGTTRTSGTTRSSGATRSSGSPRSSGSGFPFGGGTRSSGSSRTSGSPRSSGGGFSFGGFTGRGGSSRPSGGGRSGPSFRGGGGHSRGGGAGRR